MTHISIPFSFTSDEAKEVYNYEAPKYATEGSAGFDLRAVEFNLDKFNNEKYVITSLPKSENSNAAHIIIAQDGKYVIRIWGNDADHCTLMPKQYILIKTGLKCKIPEGYCLQITPRSGLALKHGISIVNSPGIIDSDYRGEIGVILINHGHEPFEIKKGDRIAQAVLVPIAQASFDEIPLESFEEEMSVRGNQGFGSTGKT